MPVRFAGYQGAASILSRAMVLLSEGLRQHGGFWADLEWQANVTDSAQTAASLFQSVEQNQRQLCYMASGYLSHRVSELQILDLPFAHPHRTQLMAALDGFAGQQLCAAIERHTAYRCLGFWDNGQRHISNALRPIHRPSDIQGMHIRTLDSAIYRQSLDAMGFVARTCDVKDLVAWVSQGTVQAQENPLTNLLGFELWRHHRHVSLTAHFSGVLLLLCPQSWHDALTPAQQAQLSLAMAEATVLQRQWASEEDRRALAELPALGVQVLGTDQVDRSAFYDATQTVRQKVCAQLPRPLLDAFGLS